MLGLVNGSHAKKLSKLVGKNVYIIDLYRDKIKSVIYHQNFIFVGYIAYNETERSMSNCHTLIHD